MNCAECKERLYPVDPAQFQHGFEPLCRHCPNYEEPGPIAAQAPEPAWTRKQWGYVQQLEAKVVHLTNKLNEHIDRAKKNKGDKL